MTRPSDSLPDSYFEAKYTADIDPWRFRTSDYERQKYRATIAALTKSVYRRGLEVGCSIGVLSALLAPRCDYLLALDGSQTAVTEARRQTIPNLSFEVACLPDQFPQATFDLILLSEVLYYFSVADLARVAQLCLDAIEPGGDIVLCHWLGETDYPLTGVAASELFAAAASSRLPVRAILHDEIYRLERLSWPSDDAK
ncbi:MAG: class I SAM-dependent methyltransferase [Bradyrhizobium sp.]|uniref:class I SAM-dependent DNA methyltransferase n=1 Tax=Bradyrhizobium sp. TaxID=376 RepID=UPI0029A10542|nr:class I SAM-dependent methyltransferase [Bradyrhizobium sp.]MDX3969129.1 class I SAM-dependent methyltransferase [Bradyrhizobium sp.]